MNTPKNIDLGSVQVHRKVLAEIIANSVREVEGASLKEPGFGEMFFQFWRAAEYPGIRIHLDEHSAMNVEVDVCVQSGYNIVDLARVLQDTVRTSLEKMVDVNLKDISINVLGIERRGA